jgi:hypothetical protein
MSNNPFDPKNSDLAALLRAMGQQPRPLENPLERALGLGDAIGALNDAGHSAYSNHRLGLGALSDAFPRSAAVSDLFGSPPPTTPASGYGAAASDLFPFGFAPAPPKLAVKRKAFFSFHYDDIMRVNVVRNAWKIDHPDNALTRSFYDSSLWESRKLEGDDAVKRLIREGVEYTSAVCVLIGSETWLRRWVKYEIARAIIDGRGLLGVHLNSIRHHQTLTPHTRGHNPFEFMAVGKVQQGILSTPKYYLYEKVAMPNGIAGYKFEWVPYGDYTISVPLPQWLADPQPGYVTPLSHNTIVYDYIADNGYQNIGRWIDNAAQRAGR